MHILALDTSSAQGSMAVFEDATVCGLIRWCPGEDYSSKLFRDLDRLLVQTGERMNRFDLFAVVAGPGSFTGLRVGLTAVKGWSEIYGRPVAAISALEALAATSQSRCQFLAPVLDAQRGQVFGGMYKKAGEELQPVAEDVVMSPAEFLALPEVQRHRGEIAVVTPTPELLRLPAAAAGLEAAQIEVVEWLLAPAVGRLGMERARKGRTVDAMTLDAHYVRRSDAEMAWKESA
jgi:tRNA threonylcarbamoyladenosine biosynthesis protein TsaB